MIKKNESTNNTSFLEKCLHNLPQSPYHCGSSYEKMKNAYKLLWNLIVLISFFQRIWGNVNATISGGQFWHQEIHYKGGSGAYLLPEQ